MKTNPQRIPALDSLRVISILAVVLVHTTTRTLESVSLNVTSLPWTLFLNQIPRFAVPLFFIISGFSLELNYSGHSGYPAFIKKRASRIFVPYLLWSFIYYFFVYKIHRFGLWETLAYGEASYQLYFIPALFLFYLLFPIFHRLYNLFSGKIIIFLLGILQFYLLYHQYYIKTLPFIYPVCVVLLNYYFFLIGAVVSRNQFVVLDFIRKFIYPLATLTVALGIYIFLEGKYLFVKTGDYQYFYTSWRPSIFFYTLSLAGVLYYLFSRFQSKFLFLQFLSRFSFFVFFVHIIFLELIWQYIVIPFNLNNYSGYYWFDPAFFIIVSAASFISAGIIHKLLKKYAFITG